MLYGRGKSSRQYINAYPKHGHWKCMAIKIGGCAVKNLLALFIISRNAQSRSIWIAQDLCSCRWSGPRTAAMLFRSETVRNWSAPRPTGFKALYQMRKRVYKRNMKIEKLKGRLKSLGGPRRMNCGNYRHKLEDTIVVRRHNELLDISL